MLARLTDPFAKCAPAPPGPLSSQAEFGQTMRELLAQHHNVPLEQVDQVPEDELARAAKWAQASAAGLSVRSASQALHRFFLSA